MRQIEPEDKEDKGPGYVRIHMERRFLDDLHWWCKGRTIIVPLLDPRYVTIGWECRKKRREELADQWRILKEEIDPYSPFYLPIDRPDRNDRLNAISQELGIKLKTDWPTIGHCPAPRSELNEVDERLLHDWMKDGFFEQFGYELEVTF